MNTTFTTYAEKKAKQFFNLLQGYTKGIRITAILILLLMGVSNAWADNGDFYNTYLTYTFGTTDGSAEDKDNGTGLSKDLGTLNSGSFKVTAVYLKCWDDWGSNYKSSGGQMCYSKDGGDTQYLTGFSRSNKAYNSNNYEWRNTNANLTIANSTDKSGSYTLSCWFQTWGDNWGDRFFPKSSGNYTFTYKIAPPSVKSFTVSPSGNKLSGSGTQNDPYIIKYNGSLTLTLSGSQNHTDANSTIQYNTAGTWNTTNSRTISNITSTDVKNVTVKARYKNKTEALYGTETSQTIYYRSEQVYTVTFNANGHGTAPAAQTVSQGSKATQPTAPTATGYTFGGWYKEAGCTNAFDFNTAINANITLYAKWTEKTYSLTFKHDGNGTIKVGGTAVNSGNTATVNYHTTKALVATPNIGYTFSEWALSGSNTSAVTIGSTTTASTTIKATNTGATVTANFTPKTYTITYKDQGGSNFSGTHADGHPTTHTYGTETTLKTATKTGYTFDGWHTDQACTNKVTSLGATAYTANITLHAKWTESQEKHEVRVLYMCGDVVVKTEETIAVGEILPTSITAPAVTGYTFSEWKLGDGLVTTDNLTAQKINLTTKPSGDYTLTANYIKYQYTLTFGVLGYGGSVSAIADGNEIASPAPLGQDSKVTLTATAKDGYVFHKWINSTGAEVSEANPYEHTMTESTTINAVFKNTRMLYLKLNDKWSRELNNGVWFAAYFFNTSNENYWVKMSTEKACENNGYYKTPIPEGNWTNVIFVRMNNANQTWLSFDNKWDKTIDLTIPKDGKNLFTLYNDHEGDNCNGTWSAHTSTYEPVYLTYNVEVPAGTPNCYISGEINGWSFTEMEKVDDTHYTITIQDACPNDEYKYCYGPSWGCQEVKQSDFTAINNRTHKNSDKVEAWIKYCIVGQDLGNWDWIDHFEFDLDGDINSLTHHLNQNTNGYKFKVKSSIGEYYTTDSQDGNKHIFHSMHTSEKIPQTAGDWHELILKVDVAGYHHFLFDPVSKLLTIEFPEKGYRLKITMTDGSEKVYTSNAVDDETEILSFFAPINADGTITLEREGQPILEFTAPTISESGVYTAKLNSDKKSITTPIAYSGNYYIRTDGANGGWSNYKTDSDNKMTYFVPREEEKYSYYWVSALPRGERNTSNGVVNVKACVANDYNDNLATMLEADKFTSDNYGNVNILDPDEHHLEKINVRFGYNPKTNFFERAMLTGSGNINTFLNIFDPLPEGYLYKTNNNGALETRLTAASQDNKFTDISNWVYERDVWVNVQNDKDVTVCLTAVSYNGARNSLFGFDDADQKVPTQRTIVAKNSTEGPKKMRVIYDFKTNRMIMAWIPGAYNCDKEEALIADVLFMRHENDPVPQLTMTDPDGAEGVTPQIKGIQTQFFALELENKGNQNYEEHYWITLPFNCIVGSISGVPGYMQTWGIQRYNGKKRAEKGWWKETETFWEWLGPDDVMEAGVGYVLSFDKSAATWNTFDVHEEDANGNIVNTTQKSLLRLYFPSTEKDFTFKATNEFEKKYVNEPCTIQTADRYKQDGNWKIIGPLSYNSASASSENATDNVWKPEKDSTHIDVPDEEYTWDKPMFLYEYEYDNSDANTRKNNWKYIVRNASDYTYRAFYGYMVQFAGTITWREITQSTHSALRARTFTDQVPTNITTNLELVDADGVQHDQTFVSLDIEGTTTYDLNKDLNKVFNNNFANIYTLSEGIPFAGNTLPMEKAIVPVGVRIATAGEYTFRMPDGTEGIYVTLIDNQTGTQTDMLMSEYTITLDAGTIENRFYLVVDPDRTATSVENVGSGANGDEAKGVEKFLIDGKLFIRTADGIFDAKGQRL